MSVTIILNQIITMVMIAGVGYYLFRKQWLGNQTVSELSAILLKIITPLILIKNLYVPFTQESLELFKLIFLLTTVSIVLGFTISNIFFRSHQGVERFGSGFSNAGFLGIPLVTGIIGQNAVIYVIPYIVFQAIVMWTYGVKLMSNGREKITLKSMISNPNILAFIFAIIIFFAQIKIPTVILSSIDYLTSLNTPLAMIILGCYIAQINHSNSLSFSQLVLPISVKLIIIPLVTIFVYKFLPVQNVNMLLAMIIVVAAPSATSTVMFASVFKNDYIKAAQIVSYSTLACAITLPVIITLALKVLGS